MAYTKRATRKTYKRKPVSWYNKKYSTYDIARQALAATKYIKGLVNSEQFHSDQTLALGLNQSAIFHLTSLTQGDGDNGRTGNSILLKNIYIRGTTAINSAVTSNTRVALFLVKDTQQISDTTPTISDIFVSGTDPDTLLKTNTFGRYKILWRKQHVMTPVSGGRNVIEFSKYWKLYDHVRFNGSTSSDIQKNGYYFIMISSENVNFPSCLINSRIGYHDN